jgi:hypothetical protein
MVVGKDICAALRSRSIAMTRFVLIGLVAIGLAACKQKPPAESGTSAPAKSPGVSIDGAADPAAPAVDPATAAAPPPPPPPDPNTPPSDTPATGPAMDLAGSTELDDMSKLLQQFVVERKRFPVDVAEMAKLMGFRLPALQPGAKLIIDKENKQIRYVPPGK